MPSVGEKRVVGGYGEEFTPNGWLKVVGAADADIAALQALTADVANATQAELDAALADIAAGDAALQAALDAHALGDASDAEVALIEAALQAQIDAINAQLPIDLSAYRTSADQDAIDTADVDALAAEATRAVTAESALQTALDVQEAKQDAHEQSRARPHLPAGGTVGQQPEIAADDSIVWVDKISVNPANWITGVGAPATAPGSDYYYHQLDAPGGENNVWGPSIADGSYPAQADNKSINFQVGAAAQLIEGDAAEDDPRIWAGKTLRERFDKKLRIEITSGLVLEPGNSYVTYGNPYTLPPAGPLGEEIDVLHDVPVKGSAAAVVSGANTKRLVSGASLPPLPIQPGNRILYVSDGTDWAVSVDQAPVSLQLGSLNDGETLIPGVYYSVTTPVAATPADNMELNLPSGFSGVLLVSISPTGAGPLDIVQTGSATNDRIIYVDETGTQLVNGRFTIGLEHKGYVVAIMGDPTSSVLGSTPTGIWSVGRLPNFASAEFAQHSNTALYIPFDEGLGDLTITDTSVLVGGEDRVKGSHVVTAGAGDGLTLPFQDCVIDLYFKNATENVINVGTVGTDSVAHRILDITTGALSASAAAGDSGQASINVVQTRDMGAEGYWVRLKVYNPAAGAVFRVGAYVVDATAAWEADMAWYVWAAADLPKETFTGDQTVAKWEGVQAINSTGHTNLPSLNVDFSTLSTDAHVLLSFVDDNNDWTYSSLLFLSELAGRDNGGLALRHASGYVWVRIGDAATGTLQARESGAAVHLKRIILKDDAVNGFVIPSATVSKTQVQISVTGDGTTINGGQASGNYLEGAGENTLRVDLPVGEVIDKAATDAAIAAIVGVSGVVDDPYNGKISFTILDGTGNVAIPITLIPSLASTLPVFETVQVVNNGTHVFAALPELEFKMGITHRQITAQATGADVTINNVFSRWEQSTEGQASAASLTFTAGTDRNVCATDINFSAAGAGERTAFDYNGRRWVIQGYVGNSWVTNEITLQAAGV